MTGIGDVPYKPVRLFSTLVEQNPSAAIFMHSTLAQLMETAEEVFPAVVPEGVIDLAPRIRQ
jgi:nitrous oxidase accessory protein